MSIRQERRLIFGIILVYISVAGLLLRPIWHSQTESDWRKKRALSKYLRLELKDLQPLYKEMNISMGGGETQIFPTRYVSVPSSNTSFNDQGGQPMPTPKKKLIGENKKVDPGVSGPSVMYNISELMTCGPDKKRVIPTDLYQLAPEIFDLVPTRFLQRYKNPCWKDRKGGLQCLPFFFVIGVSKCGTTDIWSKISMHPQVASSTKETHYWRDRKPGTKAFEKYLERGKSLISRLNKGDKTAVYGDGSSTTFYDHYSLVRDHPDLLERGMPFTNADILHAILPNAKFILSVREPTDRAYSDYLYRPIGLGLHDRQTPRLFHRLTEEYIQKFNSCKKLLPEKSCFYWKTSDTDRSFSLKVGMYAAFLRHWLEVYPKEQFFITTIDQWHNNCASLLKKLFIFLELDDLSAKHISSICAKKAANSNKDAIRKTGNILPATKRLLHDFYEPYNKELTRVLNNTQYNWD